MLKSLVSLALLVSAGGLVSPTGAWAASSSTDFGIRTVGVRTMSGQITSVVTNSTSKALLASSGLPSPLSSLAPLRSGVNLRGGVNLRAAASLGAQWGRVTSTIRSVAHNREVGGVSNSWHLSGRAIDIARRPGVTHAMIAAAFRNAGYDLIESLDEGDHSHFAFGWGAHREPGRPVQQAGTSAATQWRIVTVASAALR
jgi:peptidase M15-like protein